MIQWRSRNQVTYFSLSLSLCKIGPRSGGFSKVAGKLSSFFLRGVLSLSSTVIRVVCLVCFRHCVSFQKRTPWKYVTTVRRSLCNYFVFKVKTILCSATSSYFGIFFLRLRIFYYLFLLSTIYLRN